MTNTPGSSDALEETHAKLIYQHLERILRADYSQSLPTDWEGVDGAIANIINQIAESRELFHQSLLYAFESIREPAATESVIDPETMPGRMGDVVKGLNEMRYELLTQLQGLEVLSRGESVAGLRGERSPSSAGISAEVQSNVSAILFVLREGILGRAMNSRLTSTIANFNQSAQQGFGLEAEAYAIIREMAELIGAVQGRFYLRSAHDDGPQFVLMTSFSAWGMTDEHERGDLCDLVIEEAANEGELSVLVNPPLARYQSLSSFGQEQPWRVAVLPIIFNQKVQGIIELAAKHQYPASAIEFLTNSHVIIGLTINNSNLYQLSEQLLAKSIVRAEELEIERENLNILNHELEFQTLELLIHRKKIEKTQSQLMKKTEELEESSKYKSQFFSKISHELRTPITSLLILTELLKENPKGHLDAGELEFAKMIHASSEDLISLINDILDLSKIEAGVISINKLQYSLIDIINKSASTFHQIALNRGIDFKMLLDTDLPSLLFTDELRLRQIINNLLSNAFKYTEEGEVSLRVERVDSGWSRNQMNLNEAEGVLAFTFKDSGLGIPPAFFADIFKIFNRGDLHLSNQFGGTGLGLAISHEMAELLGGELRLIHSVPNQGSTFTLFLPLEEAHDQSDPFRIEIPKKPARSSASAKKFVGKKVLVVDDDAKTVASLCAALQSLGLFPYSASNGLSAIAFLQEAKDIDLVFMDCAMPEMDGVETIARINKSETIKKLPIVVLTAQATEQDRTDCFQAGACDYASKPIAKKKLIALLQRWLP